jgi:hypothetical protein
MEKLKE